MSTLGSYPTRTFKESQKFLVLDPETQSTSLVLGRDLVEYITPQSTYVFAEQSRAVAQNEDYQIGSLIQTAGDLTAGDNFAGTFLVVPGGDGDFPMANGNDLLIIRGDVLLREQLASSDSGEGSDRVAYTGTAETVTEALDRYQGEINARVHEVNLVSGLASISFPAEGDQALVSGVPFRYNGVSWEPSDGFVTPEIYEADGNGISDDSSAFSSISEAYPSGIKIVCLNSYFLATPVTFSSKIEIFGGLFRHDTLSVTGGLFNFSVGADGSTIRDVIIEGPEDRASWEASDNSILYSSIYSESVSGLLFENVLSSKTRITISLVGCPGAKVQKFNNNGFLPDVNPPSTGGGSLVPPYIAGINWAESMRFIDCDDLYLEDCQADHHGNVITIGGTCQRPYIKNVRTYHMHDNGVYLSSSDRANVDGVYAEDCRGSAVKARGSRSRIRNVFGRRCAIGVTVSSLPISGTTIPADQQIDTDVVVEGVEINDGFLIALADSVNIDGTEVALSNVTFRGLRGFVIRGLATLGAIRATVAGEKCLIEDFFVSGCLADWPVQIGGIATAPAEYVHNCVIRNGHLVGCNTIGRVFQCRGWIMENITTADMASVSSTVVIEPINCVDGLIQNVRNNDDSYRIDCRDPENLRISVINNRAFVFDGAQIENYGNATTSLKNITTTAPFKAGQMCLTSAGNVAISAGTTIASWREIT